MKIDAFVRALSRLGVTIDTYTNNKNGLIIIIFSKRIFYYGFIYLFYFREALKYFIVMASKETTM